MTAVASAPPLIDRALQGLRRHVLRQLNHWEGAAERLDDFEATASPAAWTILERRVGVTLREELKEARDQLKREALAVRATFNAARTRSDLENVARTVMRFRHRYLQTELLVDFYVDAVRSRTNPEVGAQLHACDIMSERAIGDALAQLNVAVPPIITYFKPGIGASILRIGTSLWDGSLSRVAAIKVTWHNRLRTTALFHECGHQFAALSGWNDAFARAMATITPALGGEAAEALVSWAGEMAADTFAFAQTGFAAVSAVSDVVSGNPETVFRFNPMDPHPIAYLRVMLGVEMCRRFYGAGPWDELASSWQMLYPISLAPPIAAALVGALMPALPRIVHAALLTELRCFRGRRLADIIDPQRVSPTALRQLQREAGAAALTSTHWLWTECIRLTALSGLRYAMEPERGPQILKEQEDWMVRLGQMVTQPAASA